MNSERSNSNSGPGLHAEALPLIYDLFKPNPLIYWADFLLCTTIGWTAFALTLAQENFSFPQIAYFLITSLALYRSAIFIHEIAHFKPGTFPLFRTVWNLLIGFPILLPSFSYTGVHINHHKRSEYGRKEDGEYLPFVDMGRLFMLWYLFSAILIPGILFLRCLILTPLSFIFPPIKRWSWRHLSSLAIDMSYQRPDPKPEEIPYIKIQETMTFLYWVTFFVLILKGIITIKLVACWYLMASFVLFLNSVRTLAAHRYVNPGNIPMSIDDQYLDSVDIRGNPYYTTLWAPVGLRYHATHHLFPTVPYHNLGKVRARLEEKLKANQGVYAKSLRPNLVTVLEELWSASNWLPKRKPIPLVSQEA